MRVGQHLICQKVIVPYMINADNDIMFTIKFSNEILNGRVWSETALSDDI